MIRPAKLCILAVLLFFGVSVAAQTPLTADQYITEGGKYAKEKQYDKAAESYKQAIRLNPDSAAAYHGLGSVYNNMGRVPDAYEALKVAARLDPENAPIRLNLGVTLSNLRRYDEAIAELNEAKRLNPNDGRIYNMLGNVQSNLGRMEDAVTFYKKAIELNSEVAVNNHNIGLMYMRLGKFSEAVAPFQEALRLEPAYRNARFYLSDAYSHTGRYAEATESWTKFLEIVPNGPEALTKRAWNYLYLGQHGREAAADARKFLEVHGWKNQYSTYMSVMANIGFREAGMLTEAQTVIAEAVKKSNPDTWAYSITRYYKGEISADELMKLAVDNDKKTEAHTYIGMDLLLNGKSNDARTHFEWVRDYGNKRFLEYPLAIEELKRLGV